MADPTAVPRLAEAQRALAVDRLSKDDRAHLVLQFAQDFPEQFDTALFELRLRYETKAEVA
jgi:hypothetical protein